MDWLWTNPTESREGPKGSSFFCGFTTGEEVMEDSRNDRQDTHKSSLVDGNDEYRDVPDPNSSLWSSLLTNSIIVQNMIVYIQNRYAIGLSYCNTL